MPSTTTTTTPTNETTGGLVKPPPDVAVPKVPAGFVPSNAKDYRGFRPKSSELAVVPDVVLELAGFHNYQTVFGQTAPPVADVAQALDAASQWTSVLADSNDWHEYVHSQEGMAWKDALALVDRLKAPFELAVAHDPTLLSRFPGLARLLRAGKVIAKRASATKKRNAVTKAQLAAKAQASHVDPAAAPAAGATVHGA
jgi:hypothetical protein